MVSAMRKVQIKCYGGSAEREVPSGWPIREGFVKDGVSAWVLKQTEESVPGGENIPGDENSKTKGTETGRLGTLPAMTRGGL